ncbi:hypothetical protein NBRC116583_17890 [Arenicella sp. 4NH20-0111]|uniref:TMEM175 family protein n=1 Tax=Arenicella sp. 4NH20-0111 TaxID=3127648 RepID=UPI0031054C3C
MPKQIVSEMQWTQKELEALPMEKGFRMRGLETTRLDTLIDAAFAFVLSMLVISQGQIPSSFDDLMVGIKSIPALAMSFWILMLFWLSHRQWSRRFGIESKSSIVLSISLVFSLLIYVYPLRILFELMFHGLSDGYFPRSFNIVNEKEVRGFFIFYAVGYLVMSLLIMCLQYLAIKRTKSLALSEFEHSVTKATCVRWLGSIFISVISIGISCFAPVNLVPLAGYIFFIVLIVQIFEQGSIRRYKKRYA